jgi:hypothetical protein
MIGGGRTGVHGEVHRFEHVPGHARSTPDVPGERVRCAAMGGPAWAPGSSHRASDAPSRRPFGHDRDLPVSRPPSIRKNAMIGSHHRCPDLRRRSRIGDETLPFATDPGQLSMNRPHRFPG